MQGEISSRLAELFPAARVLGVDILDAHLTRARERFGRLGPRLAFEHRSLFELGLPDRTFDLTVCRHVLQSIPQAERALAELMRVTTVGGRLHLIAEDYGMLQFHKGGLDPSEFWAEAPRKFGAATGTDLFIGRNTFGLLTALGAKDFTIDYVIVDTLRVPRETFAAIIEAWRDGYAADTAAATRLSHAEVVAYFNQMIANITDPRGYAVWFVPAVSARV